MQKIILVANTSWSMVKFRSSLMKKLVSEHYKVYVVSPYDAYAKDIKRIGCQFIDLKIDNKGSNPIYDINMLYKLYRIYRKIKPDLVIHYTIKPNIYGSIAAKLSRCSSIAIVTGLGYTFINKSFTTKIAEFLYRLAFRFPKEIWFLNQEDREIFIHKKLASKAITKLIPGEGVNLQHFMTRKNKEEQKKFIFLLMARILKDKGIYEYIDAIKILQKEYLNVEYQLLGSLHAMNPTSIQEKEVQSWVEKNIVNYLGEVKDVRPYIENADCIVLPSYREGLSMSLLEAASMSRPIIASNIPGCKEVVSDSVNGYLCEAGNAKDLAEKMEQMLTLSNNNRVEMGRAGRKKVLREFDEQIVIKQYLESIERFCQHNTL